MRKIGTNLCFILLFAPAAIAQTIAVNPNGVNVNVSGATTVFLTFGPVGSFRAAEGTWCGELIPATPDNGLRCNPATIFGSLPGRFDLSRSSGGSGFTDIMSIPPSVARRAYQAAEDGAVSSFFYVRRFISTTGGRDEYVPVTCRLSGGGARTPFALTDVRVSFDTRTANNAPDSSIVQVGAGSKPPPIKAEISYNGTGRLRGRWEVVLPGEQSPDDFDLLTEASLPIEQRAQQRRYTELSRFNIFLPPAGKYTLGGPDVARLPATLEGSYLVLLRIEATDDKEGDSNLLTVGAGPGIVHSGAVAGFPIPVLRYFIGSGQPGEKVTVRLLAPAENVAVGAGQPIEFKWTAIDGAVLYQLEIADQQGQLMHSALMQPATLNYRAPSWLRERFPGTGVKWRISVLDKSGGKTIETPWQRLQLAK